MRTDELISLLAANATAVPRGAASRQLAIAMTVGISLAILAMLLTMGFRSDLPHAIRGPVFWIKVLVPAAMACAGFVTLTRLARPGVDARAWLWAMILPVMSLWLIAIATYVSAPFSERAAMVWGQSWRTCTVSVLMVSAPVFVAAFLALRGLAPTRLRHAGACAGTLSGAAGAAIYSFHCPETAMPFVAIWYVAGILIMAGIGTALGPRLLRW